LNLKAEAARVYLPPDANCFLSTIHHCLGSKNYVNLMIGSKQPTGVFLSPEEAAEHCRKGASIWEFASTDSGKEPDVVIAGIGVEVTFEVVKAAEILRDWFPELRVRVVNVTLWFLLPRRVTPIRSAEPTSSTCSPKTRPYASTTMDTLLNFKVFCSVAPVCTA
jgi:xylulose-5-phosphate/fructose-6-phosphate phosphoketolase